MQIVKLWILSSLILMIVSIIFQVQSEKLLVWNLAVRDFHILINMVKVQSHISLSLSTIYFINDTPEILMCSA